jgi:serine O-acetyltransferase
MEADAPIFREWAARRASRCFPPDLKGRVEKLALGLLGLLYPHYSENPTCSEAELRREFEGLRTELYALARDLNPERPVTGEIEAFLAQLPEIDRLLALDAKAIFEGDPAASSEQEVTLTYPGFFAIALHRMSHALYAQGLPILPRLISEFAHRETGIDIHPGAQIGRSFFIDHGTGVVIGETTEIGNGVKVYQGVTLGALAVAKSLASKKRHPTLENHVVVYANATILGGETVIGHDSIIAGNAFLSESVPPFSFVGRHSDVRPRKAGDDANLEFHI